MEEEEAVEAVEIDTHEMTHFAGVEPKLSVHQSQGSFLSNFSVTSCTISHTSFARTFVCIFLVVTCVPLVAGAAFTSIFIEDGNYNAAVASFFTACLSLGSASLFALHLLRKLEKLHDIRTLEDLKIFGMVLSVASGISLGVYTILAFFNKQDFDLHGLNYFSSAVFSGLCLASSVELYVVAQWYQNALMIVKKTEVVNSYTLRPTSAVIN